MTQADRKRQKARKMRKQVKPKQKRRFGDLIIAVPILVFIGILVIIYGPFFGGNEAPDFTVLDVQGRGAFTLSNHKGEVVLIEFFSTTCDHCQAYHPTIEEIRNKYSEQALTMISISVSWAHDSEETLRLYTENFPINWYLALDNSTITEDYNVGGTPTTIIVDRDGSVFFRRSGLITSSVLSEEIDSLI